VTRKSADRTQIIRIYRMGADKAVHRGCPKRVFFGYQTATGRGEAVFQVPPVELDTRFALLYGQPVLQF
jgi:hypothetical protein